MSSRLTNTSSSSSLLERQWIRPALAAVAVTGTAALVLLHRRRRRLAREAAAAAAAEIEAKRLAAIEAAKAEIERKKQDRRNGKLEKSAGIVVQVSEPYPK
jgi:hypothetical protein